MGKFYYEWRLNAMKFVAIYKLGTGEITALVALPPDAGAPSVGRQMEPGESRVEFEAPKELSFEHNDPQLPARMEQIVKEYSIEKTNDVNRLGISYP
jgi:hypothetical protein